MRKEDQMRIGSDEVYITRCPACGDVDDFCQGHGELGDPVGRQILDQHDEGDHTSCNPIGCEEASQA